MLHLWAHPSHPLGVRELAFLPQRPLWAAVSLGNAWSRIIIFPTNTFYQYCENNSVQTSKVFAYPLLSATTFPSHTDLTAAVYTRPLFDNQMSPRRHRCSELDYVNPVFCMDADTAFVTGQPDEIQLPLRVREV